MGLLAMRMGLLRLLVLLLVLLVLVLLVGILPRTHFDNCDARIVKEKLVICG